MYTDEQGLPLYKSVRREPGKKAKKDFFQNKWDESTRTWGNSMDGVRYVLYRLPDVVQAVLDGKTIYIVEGEKDVNNLRARGLTATCNVAGAGKWKKIYNHSLAGAHVVIIPDNDDPGRNHALAIAQSLHGITASTRVLALPDLPMKGDVSDWLTVAGNDVHTLEVLAQQAPLFRQTPQPVPNAPAATVDLTAFACTDAGNAERYIALEAQDVRYVVEHKRWRVWDGACWADDYAGAIYTRAIAAMRALHVQAAHLPDLDQRMRLAKHAIQSEQESRLKSIVSLARYQPGISVLATMFENEIHLLNVANGVLDLRTGALMPHERHYMFAHVLDVGYHPQAQCPTWHAFLHKIFDGNQNLIDFMQRVVGYTLTGDVSEQVLFFSTAPGRTARARS